MAEGRCRSCGAVIEWVNTARGSNMPLDPQPTPDGNVVMVANEYGAAVAVILRKDEEPSPDEPRFVSHFATCPQAATHRKAK